MAPALRTQSDIGLNVHCTVQYAYSCLLVAAYGNEVFVLYSKKRLLCTVEINFAFASLWLLIYLHRGVGAGSRICGSL